TYDLTLPADAGSLLGFLRAPHQADLLEELFLMAEGFRIAAHLARAYPGLAREQRLAAQQILARQPAGQLPSQAQLMDAVLMWLLAGSDHGGLPAWLRPMAAVVGPCLAPLANRDATANDAL